MIDHERRHVFQEFSKELFRFSRKRCFFGDFRQRIFHELHPSIARRLVDSEWRVPGAKPGMAALFDVSRLTAESIDHDHVMETGAQVAEIFQELLRRVISKIGAENGS